MCGLGKQNSCGVDALKFSVSVSSLRENHTDLDGHTKYCSDLVIQRPPRPKMDHNEARRTMLDRLATHALGKADPWLISTRVETTILFWK